MAAMHGTERYFIARAVATFVVILAFLSMAGWIVWSNHDTAVRAVHNGQHIESLQRNITAEQRELRAAQHSLAVLQRQSSASNCNAISSTNANMRKAVHDLTQPLPITSDLKPDAVRLRVQSNAQKAIIRAVFEHRFPALHYDGHHCTTTKGRTP